MKILGTLTVDTPNDLDKVTDLNADLLDGKSSQQYLSRTPSNFNYEANYERSSVDNNTEDTSITLGRDTILTSTATKVANSSLILKTGGLNNNGTTSNPSSLTLYKNGDSPSGNTIILGSAGIVNTSGALILNNDSSGDFLIKQGATNEVRLRIAETVTYLGNFTNASIGGATATYVAKFDTALVVGTPTTAATSPAVFIGRFNRTVGANTNSEASVAGIDFKGNILTGLSIIGKSIVFRTDDSGVVSDTTISDRMVISSTGLIGIGLANPTTMLQIKPNNNNTGLIKCTNAADTKTLFDVDSVGRVGINATPFENTQLALTGTSSTTTTGRFGIYNDLTHNIAAATDSVYGLYTRVTADSTNGSTLATVYGLYVAAIAGNVVVGNKYGIYQVGTADANVFYGATTFGNAFTLSAITNTINIGYLQTSGVLTLGGALQTGIITLGRSTVTHTLNIDAGVTTSDKVKTINIGTGGVTGSTTTITYGSTIGTTHTFNGNVGIGTSSPSTALSFPIGTNTYVGQTHSTPHAASNVGSIGFGIYDGGGQTGVFVNNTHNGTYSSQDIRFLTAQGGISGSTERMRIGNSGNVLIGKTTDDGINKLQVEGSASVSGNVGIGTSLPASILDIVGSTGDPTLTLRSSSPSYSGVLNIHAAGYGASNIFATGGSNALSFSTNSVSRMFIDSSGNVGVGTTAPTEKLHVVGNVLATGTVSGSNIFTQYHWSFTIATANTSGCTIKSDTYNTALCSNSAFYKRTASNTSLGTASDVDFSSYLICVYIMAGIGNWEIVYPDIVIESGGVIAITFASDQHNNIFKVVMV